MTDRIITTNQGIASTRYETQRKFETVGETQHRYVVALAQCKSQFRNQTPSTLRVHRISDNSPHSVSKAHSKCKYRSLHQRQLDLSATQTDWTNSLCNA